MIHQSSISLFSTFFFVVCAIKAVFVITTIISYVSFYFICFIWVTLPRAAQLLTHVPPNGGK